MDSDSGSENYSNPERLINAARGSRLAQVLYEFRAYFKDPGAPEDYDQRQAGSTESKRLIEGVEPQHEPGKSSSVFPAHSPDQDSDHSP